MGDILSKKKNSLHDKVTEEDRAILALKVQRDNMKKAFRRYENNIKREKEMARALLKDGYKERALLLLKRKRYQETLMDRISKQLEQVQRLVNEIEAAQLNKEVFERLRQGNEALQVLNEAFSIEDAERIMENTREATAIQQEISNILSNNLTSEDLKIVEEEYDEMVKDELVILPDVPTEEIEIAEAEKINEKKSRIEKVKKTAIAVEAL